jgi:hypothetical protein
VIAPGFRRGGLAVKTSVKKLAAVGFLLFLGLWVVGFLRTFSLPEAEPEVFIPSVSPFSSSGDNPRTGAKTANNLAQIGLTQAPLPQVLDQEDIHKVQVYEKTAHLTSGTTAFAEDEGRIRSAVAHWNALVFSETATGVAPHRHLSLGISVRPERFDLLLDEIRGVGQISSITVQQQDRTSEFRRLHAQRQSLKKHLDAILKLRNTGKLSVEEALKLEQKVQEVEKEVQAVGVQLGDLLDKEPAYNLFVTLQELQPGSWNDRTFTFSRRLGSGFLWALGWWFTAVLGIGTLLGAWVSVRTLWPGPSAPASGPRVPG